MKRLIAALSFSIPAVPAFATSFEHWDPCLWKPENHFHLVDHYGSHAPLPFEATQFDRAQTVREAIRLAISGSTVPEASMGTDTDFSRYLCANDYNFIPGAK